MGVNVINTKEAERILEEIEAGKMGLETGLVDLDYMLKGFQNGNLYVLGSRPAMGKTALALNIASSLIHSGKKVAIFSLEANADQMVKRLLYIDAHIRVDKYGKNLDESDTTKLSESVKALENERLVVDDTAGISVDEIAWKLDCEEAFEGTDMVIIDYLQLLSGCIEQDINSYKTRKQELNDICRKLSELARESNIPILVLSQMSRYVEKRFDKHPILSDLRDCSAIEEYADVVMFLYRDEYYNSDSELKGIADIQVVKNRFGMIGTCQLVFLRDYLKFGNIAKLGREL